MNWDAIEQVIIEWIRNRLQDCQAALEKFGEVLTELLNDMFK